MGALPTVSFSVYSRQKNCKWLVEKRDSLEKCWCNNQDGNKLLRKIIKTCNLVFPKSITKSGIDVIIKKYSRKKYGCLLGLVSVTRPERIELYVKKNDEYLNIKKTLCHELVHTLLWSTYYRDLRRAPVSLFADIFMDELLTTLLEELIIEGPSKVDFEWALDYARAETIQQLKSLKREKDYQKIIDELKRFLKDYRRAIKQGSNALNERQRALKDILSPRPLNLED